jgi:hypothetical protein
LGRDCRRIRLAQRGDRREVVTMVEDIVMTDQDQRYPRVVTIIEGNHGREERSATF